MSSLPIKNIFDVAVDVSAKYFADKFLMKKEIIDLKFEVIFNSTKNILIPLIIDYGLQNGLIDKIPVLFVKNTLNKTINLIQKNIIFQVLMDYGIYISLSKYMEKPINFVEFLIDEGVDFTTDKLLISEMLMKIT
ncbi:MAG: hypothetical protein UR73_C0001G0010 [candidate division WS6 bacterium GW2011_GWF1_35_23]|uniref:Uncharacterized protein n=1 Tax=candidate division WS6 bacterium GW2011_GWF1_35_23 TaxID=1619097 RepID=A0A0G0ETF5_9BACT|nr:MAG: hypothetical protein UR73_C0001G0010 [candidate division WS6 bacterium GW2011_GWF1_35_23]